MRALTEAEPAASPPDHREATPRTGGAGGLVWLTWRQHRWVLLSLLVFAVVVVGWMVYVSADMASLYEACHNTKCQPFTPEYAQIYGGYGLKTQAEFLALVAQYTPLLVGIFVGVPLLAREHEQRTLLLAWSQDVTPVRWLWTKLALLGAFVAVVAALVSVAAHVMAHTYVTVVGGSLFAVQTFMVTGLLPLASAVCWFTVGVALGAVIKRTLPAVFGVIAAFIGALLGLQWRYPTLMKPLVVYLQSGEPGPAGADHNALVVSGLIQFGPDTKSNLYDSPGHEVTYADLLRMCPELSNSSGTMVPDCVERNHLLTYVTYQPSSRLPLFHLIVAGGYLGLAALAVVAVWLIVRRTKLSAG
ncbi:ABC transporter permease [Dactylosporangium maewongense]|uniref:ABC transporter permease n=1 Tax=Dactylosporangium maewongense TaxID=634393 RepID=A0ABP4P534_9ACTN